MISQEVEYLETTPTPKLESIHKNITKDKLNQARLVFLRNVTSQINHLKQHQVNDPVNEPNFYYNMGQQQEQTIATSNPQFISKNELKNQKKKLILVEKATAMQKERLVTF